MTAEQFAYWLQGYAELNAAPPTAEQWQSIREHLGTVFNKITPNIELPSVPFAPGHVPPWPQTYCISSDPITATLTC